MKPEINTYFCLLYSIMLLILPMMPLGGCSSDFNESVISIDLQEINTLEMKYEEIYEPRNITPCNASYHISSDGFTIEWWYFEGIFDNGYNAVVNLILLSKNQVGICFSHLNIFHSNNSDEFYAKRMVQSMNHFSASKDYPQIQLWNNPVVMFNQTAYEMTHTWIYNLTYELDENAVNLTFTGETPGWEGPVLGGYYGPVLPIAQVCGTITINKKMINVTGLGYHEHAYGISFPFKEWGWYWGKIVGVNSSLFWGKMMNTRWKEQAHAGVFSLKDKGYTNIHPSVMSLILSNYCFHTRRFIPTAMSCTISDFEHDIFINVTLSAKTIYYLPLGLFHYWRYLVVLNGEIRYQSTVEYLLNEIQIMEVMRFR